MNDNLYRLRHSLAHVLAQAVKKLYPQAQLGFGPPIADGFYYDFDLGEASLSAAQLKKIERQMKKIIAQNQPFTRAESDYAQALARLEHEPYKREQVTALQAKGVTVFSFYTNEHFLDLCEGPHVSKTGELPVDAFKLDRIAGAYWLGDEKRRMLTRIYGLAFTTAAELQDFLARRTRAEQYDHKKLGRELEIFTFDPQVGRGLPLWLPHGTVIRDALEDYAKAVEFRHGYQRVTTPHIAKDKLYLRSQHLPAYRASMFPPLRTAEGDETFFLKPMNCPHHHLIFAFRKRSYRELPVRLAEFGTCYRYEQSGELSGLLRVRCLTIHDAHIYLRLSQLKDEFTNIIAMHREFYRTLHLEKFRVRLSTADNSKTDKYLGEQEMWTRAQQLLREACHDCQLDYFEGPGEAAFYGPKVDFQFKNLMGREETFSTIQLDFLSPLNFKLVFSNEQDAEETPLIIHRAPLSSHERLISHLLEHFGGALPLWCAPVQVMIIPVAASFQDYAQTLQRRLHAEMLRVELDSSSNSFAKKIKMAALRKIPVQLIVGANEVNRHQVTIRRHGVSEQQTVPQDEAVQLLLRENKERLSSPPAVR